MLTVSEYLSVVAITISIASLGVSSYVALRDRARLKIASRFIPESEYGPSYIVAAMVNLGRRPVILRAIGGSEGDKWACEYLDSSNGGKRLGEHERYEHKFDREATVNSNPDGEDMFYQELWVEDSLGTRHPIPDSREYIRRLWAKA